MKKFIVISTTVEQQVDAKKLANLLFHENVIGCAQVSGPLQSYYRWEGRMENSTEYMLSVKTLAYHRQRIVQLLEKNHPYDVPEITSKVLDFVSEDYGRWLEGEVTG